MTETKDEILEVKEDPSVPQSPLLIFVATLPDKFNRQTSCLNEIEKIKNYNIVLLHPYYDFNSDIGKKTLELIGDTVPRYDNPWESIMRKDMFCIERADLIIFDLDTPDIIQYLAMAVCFNKPIIAVSSILLSVPVYFSGSVSCIVKPKQLASVLNLALKDEDFLRLPQQQIVEVKKPEGDLLDDKLQDAITQMQDQIDLSWGGNAELNQKSIDSNSDGDSDTKV
jgi:hypothetical protein